MRDPLDRFYTPPRLADTLVDLLPIQHGEEVLEPSVGGGAFARALTARGCHVLGCDIDPEAAGLADCREVVRIGDFLGMAPYPPETSPRWVIGNPPYRDAEAHVRHALTVTGRHVAFLLRLAMLESARRAPFWRSAPLRRVWVLSERPSFSADGKTDSAAYGWFWFDREHHGPATLGWVSWRSAP